MSMKTSFGYDRLSELPNCLIFDIFRFLPVTDVVRTTTLSKRWENLWTSSPCLDFNSSKMTIDAKKFRGFVNGAINSWRGVKIVKFTIQFSSSCDELEESLPSDSDIYSWMKFATEKKVEELQLSIPSRYVVSQHLLLCSSLQVLCLRRFKIGIGGDVRWDQLKSLTLHVEGLSEDSMNRVLSGSPRLEFLDLSVPGYCGNLSIRSSSLKCLTIGVFGKIDAELRISTPNLEKVEFRGLLYSRCLLMDVSSLTEASYFLLLSPSCLTIEHFLMHSPNFPTTEHVERLTLTSWCIEVVGAMKNKRMLSPFPNTKFLELKLSSTGYEKSVGALAMFPKLRDLVITTCPLIEPIPAERCPETPLPQLRTVDVTWQSGDKGIFPLVQNLLKYAINLEKIVFREKKGKWVRPAPPFEASHILQKMERSSPNAEFVFCCYFDHIDDT